jgi:hypothetical protein
MAGIAGLAALCCACAQGKGMSDDELQEVQKDVADLRAETRELREEMRSVRSELRALRGGGGEEDTAGTADGESEAGRDAGTSGAEAAKAVPSKPGTSKAPGASKAIDAPPQQSSVKISLDSNPRGAKVYVGSKMMGQTPLLLEHAPGSEEISVRIEKDGYRARLLTIRPDEDSKVSVQLAKK